MFYELFLAFFFFVYNDVAKFDFSAFSIIIKREVFACWELTLPYIQKRERQDIGRLVLITVLFVELADLARRNDAHGKIYRFRVDAKPL